MKKQKGVKVVDKGWKKIQKNVKQLAKQNISLGVHEEDNSPYEGGTTPAEVAQIHEFGTKNHPEQAFLRRAEVNIQKEHLKDLKAFYEGRLDESELLLRIAKSTESKAKANIQAAGLVDSGKLLGAVKAKVSKKGDS